MHFSIIYSNSKNLDPKFESSFASMSSLQSRLWACNATFSLMRLFSATLFSVIFFSIFCNFSSLIQGSKGLLACLEICHFSLLFVILSNLFSLLLLCVKLIWPIKYFLTVTSCRRCSSGFRLAIVGLSLALEKAGWAA